MSEDEEKSKAEKALTILNTKESILRAAKAYSEKEGSARRLAELHTTAIVQAASNVSKMMEDFQTMAGGLTTQETRMARMILDSSKNIDKMFEDVSRTVGLIANMKLPTLPTYYYPHLGRFAKGLDEVEDAIDALPEVIEEEAPELEQTDKQELLNQIDQMKTEIATLREEVEKLRQESKATKKKARGANRTTRDKIVRLAEHRQEAIDQRGVVPGWISSCHYIGVDSRSVLTYAPELGDKWEDKSFRWKGFDND